MKRPKSGSLVVRVFMLLLHVSHSCQVRLGSTYRRISTLSEAPTGKFPLCPISGVASSSGTWRYHPYFLHKPRDPERLLTQARNVIISSGWNVFRKIDSMRMLSSNISVCCPVAKSMLLLLGLLLQATAMVSARVVVVGGGLAGLSAVLELADRGVPVTLIDMEKNLGGNSAKASSGMNACGTEAQKKLGIEDTPEDFYEDTLKAGDHQNNPILVETLTQESKYAQEWLLARGVPITDVTLCGGHRVPRTHWIPSPKEGKPIPVGFETIKQLKSRIDEAQAKGADIQVKTLTRAVELILMADGKVEGLSVETKSLDGTKTTPSAIAASAVILTTGGFSNDHTPHDSLLEKYAPGLKDYPTTNGPFATGSGIKMVLKSVPDVALVGMEDVQVHPTGFIDPASPKASTKFLAAEALRGSGGLLVNEKGERFADELTRRDTLTKAILERCSLNDATGTHVAYLLMNKEAVDKFGWPAFNFYFNIKKFFTEYASAAEAASALGMDAAKLSASLTAYTKSAESNSPDEFGKQIFPIPTWNPNAVLYVGQVTPSIHYTMGGLAIDSWGHVLRSDGSVVPRLYAAGEACLSCLFSKVTGGVHGSNRLGGNSLLECVVFGRRAAQKAAEDGSEAEDGSGAGKPNDEL